MFPPSADDAGILRGAAKKKTRAVGIVADNRSERGPGRIQTCISHVASGGSIHLSYGAHDQDRRLTATVLVFLSPSKPPPTKKGAALMGLHRAQMTEIRRLVSRPGVGTTPTPVALVQSLTR